ncbi:MAG: transporter substrate-binding domain-containing protein [Alphaproteobacteria bacterium]|nr:transporter substrate-binding domain-containing protein [Alphaproteobacteria bacterium]
MLGGFRTALLVALFISLFCNAAPMRVGVMTSSPPFAWQKEDGSFHGASLDLWSAIAEKNNYRFEYVSAGQNIQQALNLLDAKEIDVLVGPISVTEARYKKYDFTRPYFLNHLSLIVPAAEAGSRWRMLASALWEPLSFVLPILLCVILVMTCFFCFFDSAANRKKQHSKLHSFFDAFWEVVLILIQGEILHDTRHTGKRILTLMWLISSIGLLSILIGTVTSSLTVFDEKAEKAYRVLRSDLESQKIAVVKGSVSDQEVLRVGAAPVRVKTRMEAVKLVQENAVFGMVDDFLILKSLRSENSGMRSTQLNLKNDEIAFAFPKSSQYIQEVNKAILALQDTGMSETVCRKYLGKDAVLCLL